MSKQAEGLYEEGIIGSFLDLIAQTVEEDIKDEETKQFAKRLFAEFIVNPRFEFLSCNIWRDIDKTIQN